MQCLTAKGSAGRARHGGHVPYSAGISLPSGTQELFQRPALNAGFVTLSAMPRGATKLHGDWLACTSLELLSMLEFQTKPCFSPTPGQITKRRVRLISTRKERERPENNRCYAMLWKHHKNNLDVTSQVAPLEYWVLFSMSAPTRLSGFEGLEDSCI